MNIFSISAIFACSIVGFFVLYLMFFMIGELMFIKRALFTILNDVKDFKGWFSTYIILNRYNIDEYNNVILNINEFILFKELIIERVKTKYKKNIIMNHFTKTYLLDKTHKDLGINTMNYITRAFLERDIFLDVNKKVIL